MRALLIKTPPGTGKTRAVARSLAEKQINARVVTGTRALAAELAADHGYALISGRNEDNCHRHREVRALAERGHDVEALACGTPEKPACPFRDTCLYWHQFRQPAPWVAATEQLFNSHFLKGASLCVVDDAELPRSLVQRVFVSEEDLARTQAAVTGKRRAALRRLVTVFQHALLDAVASPKRLLGPAAWDHLQRTATRYGTSMAELLDALPKAPSLPKPVTDTGSLTHEAIEAAPPPTVLFLVKALRDELESFLAGEDFNSRIRLDGAGFEVWRLKEPVRDKFGAALIASMDLLVLDATPVEVLVNQLTALHERLPDVVVQVRLPENVSVVQYASSSNGHGVLKGKEKLDNVLAEIAAERQLHPVNSPDKEGAVCFKALRQPLIDHGFQDDRVLAFKRVRGTNSLKTVERLHLVGRPMPPSEDLLFLANAIHFGQVPVSPALALFVRPFAAQPYEVDVADFADARAAALLRSEREDEMLQAIHRARLFDFEGAQLHLVGAERPNARRELRLVLHTNQPIPGLRVDELVFRSEADDLNSVRHDKALVRIALAVAELEARRLPVTVAAVIRIAGGSRTTVSKVLRQGVHTLKKDLLSKGVYTPPGEEGKARSSLPVTDTPAEATNTCRGGCGKPMPPGQMCFACASRRATEWAQNRRSTA